MPAKASIAIKYLGVIPGESYLGSHTWGVIPRVTVYLNPPGAKESRARRVVTDDPFGRPLSTRRTGLDGDGRGGHHVRGALGRRSDRPGGPGPHFVLRDRGLRGGIAAGARHTGCAGGLRGRPGCRSL